jgi:gamma-glutamyltranspeptidase
VGGDLFGIFYSAKEGRPLIINGSGQSPREIRRELFSKDIPTPGKLPAHTLTPALVLKERKPILAIGTPGGLGQTQFLTQTLCNLFDFDMNIQEAIEAPRWQSEQTGHVELESRFSDDVGKLLVRHGYDVKVRGGWEFAFGGVEAGFLASKSRLHGSCGSKTRWLCDRILIDDYGRDYQICQS